MAQTKANELLKLTKETATAAQDTVCDAVNSVAKSGQQGQKQTTGFFQQTGGQIADMATGAKDTVCDAANAALKSGQQGQKTATGFIQQTGGQIADMATAAVDTVKNTLGVKK